ncbi:MAG: hypothetical protein IPH33_03095 [Bacteroidetes bacterium]|nr:hypothetical protein [Bacteroidota bacterium]
MKIIGVCIFIILTSQVLSFSQGKWIKEILDSSNVITNGSDSNAIYLTRVYDISTDSSLLIVGFNDEKMAKIFNSSKTQIRQMPFQGSRISISNDFRVVVINHMTTENGFYKTRIKCYNTNGLLNKDTIVQGHGEAKFINNGELLIAHNSNVWGFNLTNPETVLLILDSSFNVKLSKNISKSFRLQIKPYFDFEKSEYVFPQITKENDVKKVKMTRFNLNMDIVN